jgi:hypothetical protein
MKGLGTPPQVVNDHVSSSHLETGDLASIAVVKVERMRLVHVVDPPAELRPGVSIGKEHKPDGLVRISLPLGGNPGSRRFIHTAIAVCWLLSLTCPLRASEGSLFEVASNCVAGNERFWRSCSNPPPELSSRTLFAYALALCEAKQHPERLDRLFELAAEMQDRDPKSRGYGNFRWYRRDASVLDANAVDFCMRGGSLMWLKHRAFVPTAARARLRELLELGTTGCLKHKVPESYSNIAIMNAGDLILLGEALGNTNAAAEGYARIDRVFSYAREAGIHEFDSPTYSGVDLDGLGMIEAFCRRESGRAQTRALLELIWTDIAASWFEPAQRLAGAQSRTYDFLHGHGYLDVQLVLQGWLSGPLPRDTEVIYAAEGDWKPPQALQQFKQQFPRLVRQTWGRDAWQFRTHYLLPDITLSCSASSYGGRMDMPLTVDLPGDRQSVRCYFVADGRDDPFGLNKIAAGPHQKAFHLNPLWLAAQREVDALGLAVYRSKDIPTNTVTLKSSFVLPMAVDSIRIGDRKVQFEKSMAFRETVKPGEVVSVRQGAAVLALRIPWCRGLDNSLANVALVYDGNTAGAATLTVEHGTPVSGKPGGELSPAAAFWVRVGTGLSDGDRFGSWLAQFTKARVEVDPQGDQVRIQAEGLAGPVGVRLHGAGESAADLTPPPARVVLEVNGRDIGAKLLIPGVSMAPR